MGKTFTEQAAEAGAHVTGNEIFDRLEEAVRTGKAESPGAALAAMLAGLPGDDGGRFDRIMVPEFTKSEKNSVSKTAKK